MRYVFLNIIVPLAGGMLIYLCLSGTVLLFPFRDREPGAVSGILRRILRNYGPDSLWAYSFLNAMLFILEPARTKQIVYVFGIVLVTTAALEAGQLTVLVPGTFDVWDLALETAAETAGMLIFIKRRDKS